MLMVRRLDGAMEALSSKDIGALSGALDGQILLRADDGYARARRVFNAMIERYPGLIIQCRSVHDVGATVDFVRDRGLLLSVRGGGHSVAGTAVCDDGVMLDLSLLKEVDIDPERKVARVGGGATLGDLDRETARFQLVCPAGIVSTTGVAGLTLGGGRGWLRAKLGLTVDSLLSADVVTADGKLRCASGEDDPDLFWAIRGGGGNFGVATEFRFRLHDLPDRVVFCNPFYSAEYAPQVIAGWRECMRFAPDELTSELFLWTIPVDGRFPASVQGSDVVIPRCVYYGPVDDGLKAVAPLRRLAPVLIDRSGPAPFRTVQHALDPYLPFGKTFCYWKALSFDELSSDILNVIVAQFYDRPRGARICPMALHYFNGASRRVDPAATAYADRESWFEFEYNTSWLNPADSAENSRWVRESWSALRKVCGRGHGGYLNVQSYRDDGVGLVEETFGENYGRLREIKRRLDPDNLFRLNANIPPA